MSVTSTIRELQRSSKAEQSSDERTRHQEYAYRAQRWRDEHPDATPEEYTRAIRAIAEDCGI